MRKPSSHLRPEPACDCETKRRYKALRWALFLAAVSLAFYMPWKAITQSERLSEIYGPWFLQGAVVTVAGLLFALRPWTAAATPLVLRLGVGAASMLWMSTGFACTPHLWQSFLASPVAGGFAWLHMLTQHVFLALGVLAMVIAPRVLARRLDPRPEPASELASRTEPQSAL